MKYLLMLLLIPLVCSCDTTLRDKFFVESHERLNRAIAARLMDSAAVGLDRFYQQNGHYPQIDGKLFFDSIKTLVGDIKPYVYTDKQRIDSKYWSVDDYRSVDSCFIGNGNYDSAIIYRRLSEKDKKSNYLLYWVGQNYIDEHGTGDDMVYEKD